MLPSEFLSPPERVRFSSVRFSLPECFIVCWFAEFIAAFAALTPLPLKAFILTFTLLDKPEKDEKSADPFTGPETQIV